MKRFKLEPYGYALEKTLTGWSVHILHHGKTIGVEDCGTFDSALETLREMLSQDLDIWAQNEFDKEERGV